MAMGDHDGDQIGTGPGTEADVSGFDADATAIELRLTDQDKAFALALLGGANRTQAARMAGFPQEGTSLRKKASSLAGTRKVKRFLERARAKGVGAGPEKIIDRETRKRILSRHAVGNDPMAARSAIQELNKMEDTDTDAGRMSATDGFSEWRMVREFLTMPGGAAAIIHIWTGSGNTLAAMPLLHDVHKTAMREAPDIWRRAMASSSGTTRAEVEKQLADLTWQLAARVELWREVDVVIDTQGMKIEVLGFAPEIVPGPNNGDAVVQ